MQLGYVLIMAHLQLHGMLLLVMGLKFKSTCDLLLQESPSGMVYNLRPMQDSATPIRFTIDESQLLSTLRDHEEHAFVQIDPDAFQANLHLDFARYAAYRQLSVDLFDAESCLQIGTATVDMRGLLRQASEHSEHVVQAPVFDPLEMTAVDSSRTLDKSGVVATTTDATTKGPKGHLQVLTRLLWWTRTEEHS
jgi:hypothetical protein